MAGYNEAMLTSGARGVGIANIAMDGTILDTWYPEPQLTDEPSPSGTVRLGAQYLSPKMLSMVRIDEDRMVEQIAVETNIADLSQPAVDAHDVYLRLHLLSHRLVSPHSMNMHGVFDLLNVVAWTNKGPCLPDNFEHVRTSLRTRGLIHVYSIDRLPRMVDYVVPAGVRIAEAERVRLGAVLASGTTVLREGFVSFNSGTLGEAKIEGRLSSGVVVGANTRVGLSATLMAEQDKTGFRLPLSIGENCTIGVSAGVIGVSLGDNCVLDNGILIDKKMPVYLTAEDRTGYAAELEGQSNLHFHRRPGVSDICVDRLNPA